jgi:phosphoglycerate dehydrogenase-like enzyme
MKRVRAGINTSRKMFEYVFTKEIRDAIAALVDVDYDAVPESPDETSIAASLAGAEVVLSTWGSVPYTERILAGCPDLKLILYGAGSFKGLVTDSLLAANPVVCTSVHLNAIPTAEYTLGLILMAMKNAFAYRDAIRSHHRDGWNSARFSFSGGYYRTKIGVLGFGIVSRHLLKLLRNFEMEVFVADDYMSAEQARELGAKKAEVDYIMANCDLVTIHHADVERNWNIVNERTLALMKPGARIVNTSRGRMIDESALAAKLATGEISAYLDVTHPEPPASDHPFYGLSNCVMTPHIAGSIGREVERFGWYCWRELVSWLSGEPLENPIDIRALEGRA